MYAIVRSGNHQFKVEKGDVVRVPFFDGKAGEKVTLQEVLLIGDQDQVRIGQPLLKGAAVECTITRQGKDKRVLAFTFRRRKDSQRIRGHRQLFTELEVAGITG